MITIYKALGSVLLFFYNSFANYGWAILLFGLAVKLIMLPFQMKSKHSIMRSTMLSPQMKELEKRCGSNKQKYQEELAKLYKEAKVNPMSGCLWTLLPFPILIILYKIVRQPLSYLMFLTSEQITALTDTLTSLGLYQIPAKTDVYAEMTLANILHQNFSSVLSDPGVADFADKLLNINFNFLGLNMTVKPQLFFWQSADFSQVSSWLPGVGAVSDPVHLRRADRIADQAVPGHEPSPGRPHGPDIQDHEPVHAR